MIGASAMVTIERHYDYVYEDVSRHGQVRVYFWRGKGHRKVRMRVPMGTREFEQRYAELLAQSEAGAHKPGPRDTPIPGTLRWLGTLYVSSSEFEQLDPTTQIVARRVLDSMYAEPIAPGAKETFGDCTLQNFTAKSVGILRDRKKAKPEAANARRKRLRAMFKWALRPENSDLGITVNPARDVGKLPPLRQGGFPRWTASDLDRYEERHPVGSQARLALALLMYLGVRRSDLVRVGPPMVRDGKIAFVQFKGRNKTPIEVRTRIIPELQAIIDATPVVGTTTWLVTQYGKPFTAKSMSGVMAEWCRQAGIRPAVGPGLNNHGVRKAAATRMAERGASVHALMAQFGWLDIKQAELYTRDASRGRLAQENAHLLGTDPDRNLSHLGVRSGPESFPPAENPNEINTNSEEWRTVQDETANTYIIEIAL
jgi:integrase